MNVYIDIIFLYNLLGDYLCLCIVGSVLRKTSFIKKTIASIFGGLYGVMCAFENLSFLSTRVGIFIAAAVITAIAYFPFKFREFLSLYTVYIISSMLLGGGVTFFLYEGGSFSSILCMLGITSLLFYMLSSLRDRIFSKHMSCTLVYKNYSADITGFYDSGNRLFAYGGDTRVIIADESVLSVMFCKNTTAENLSEWVGKTTKIPFCGASDGIMNGFLLDYAVVEGRIYNDVFLAISNNKLKDSLILHSTMI